ncbi:AraC family transcriptional regulator [Pollutimonas subterranea]|nr:AraC family transcriptional regulator [Pollutimonas subterranea]
MMLAGKETTERVVAFTVSIGFLQDLLSSLEGICAQGQFNEFLNQAGIPAALTKQDNARVTHNQLVRLYQAAAVGTGDEMMGLWSRSIRSGALKLLCKGLLDASSVSVAMYRFTQFWNLLLDDYELVFSDKDTYPCIAVRPRRPDVALNRFGHALMLKLIHGVASWLVGRELPLHRITLGFDCPVYAEDYRILFPVAVTFNASCSSISFPEGIGKLGFRRSYAELLPFLQRAPRDWIFTTYKEHSFQLKVREYLHSGGRLHHSLTEVADSLHMSTRTLIRRLAAENTSFQNIKDGLRRDLAILDLTISNKSLDDIAHGLGFKSVSVFHRAFKISTGSTPGAYRNFN